MGISLAFLALLMTKVAPPKEMLPPNWYVGAVLLAEVLRGVGVGVEVAVCVGVAPDGVKVAPGVSPPEQAANVRIRMQTMAGRKHFRVSCFHMLLISL
jgi:hypothetical protein